MQSPPPVLLEADSLERAAKLSLPRWSNMPYR